MTISTSFEIYSSDSSDSSDSGLGFHGNEYMYYLLSSLFEPKSREFELFQKKENVKLKNETLKRFYTRLYMRLSVEIELIKVVEGVTPNNNNHARIIYFEGKRIELLTWDEGHSLIRHLYGLKKVLEKSLSQDGKVSIVFR